MRSGRSFTQPPSGSIVALGHPLARGLILDYLFNEGAGVRANDLSLMGNHGTISGADWVLDEGGGLDFNGSSDYVNAGKAPILEPNNFTIEALVKGTYSGASKAIVGRGTGAEVKGYHYFLLVNAGRVWMTIGSGSAYDGGYIYNGLVNDTWYHIVLRLSSAKLEGYVDGKKSSTDFNRIINPNVTANTVIGMGDAAGGYYFSGIISRVRMWQRALAPIEIRETYEQAFSMYRSGRWE